MLKKVISGGQKGVDRIGLEVAKELGIPTGGTAPKYYRTEDGNDWTLQEFGLVEHESWQYPPRTEQNVQDSHGTVIMGNIAEAGSNMTRKLCKKHSKTYLLDPTPEELVNWVELNHIEILNVAGNRGSKLTLKQKDKIRSTLYKAFHHLKYGRPNLENPLTLKGFNLRGY